MNPLKLLPLEKLAEKATESARDQLQREQKHIRDGGMPRGADPSLAGRRAERARQHAAEDEDDEEGESEAAGLLGGDSSSSSVYGSSSGAEGSLATDVRRVCVLALPIIISNVTVPLTGAVDVAIVGRLGDAAYLGGVAVGSLLFNYIYWGLGFVKMGTTGLTAHAFGAATAAGGSADAAERAKAQLLVILARAVIMAVVFGAVVVLASGGMLRLLFSAITTTDEIQRLASEYFTARVLGAPAALCNLAAMGWLLGVQEPRSCLFINVVINTTNIVLDYLLALHLGWGIRGVAFATALAQFAGAAASVLAVGRLLRQERFAGTTVQNTRAITVPCMTSSRLQCAGAWAGPRCSTGPPSPRRWP